MKHYPHTFSGRRASQDEYELSKLIDFLKGIGVRKYLEVGAREGDTFHEIMTSLPKRSFGVAVDLPGGLWGKITTSKKLESAKSDLLRKGYDVKVILGNSTHSSVIDSIKALGKFDAVFIDGDHTYEGVKKDFDNYKELAPVVIFHDIVGDGQFEKVQGNKVEVPVFWNEIKTETSLEFVGEESKMGIGVWFNPDFSK